MSTPLARYQAEFCAHLRDPRRHARPAGTVDRRIAVYRELVFNNLERTLAGCFPVCKAVLGARRWNRLVRRFLAQHASHTPLFREIPAEFLHWLQRQRSRALPPFLYALAHYEWVELAVSVSEAALNEAAVEGDLLAQVPLLAPALMLLQYDWPVQRISPQFQPAQAEPVWLLVFRNAEDEVCFSELNAVSARLVQLLQAGTLSGRAALTQVAQELQQQAPELIIAFGAEILHDLRRQQAIVGVRAGR